MFIHKSSKLQQVYLGLHEKSHPLFTEAIYSLMQIYWTGREFLSNNGGLSLPPSSPSWPLLTHCQTTPCCRDPTGEDAAVGTRGFFQVFINLAPSSESCRAIKIASARMSALIIFGDNFFFWVLAAGETFDSAFSPEMTCQVHFCLWRWMTNLFCVVQSGALLLRLDDMLWLLYYTRAVRR